MSRRFPVYNAHGVVRVLRARGFAMVGQKGSHQKWRLPNGRQVIVPLHESKPIPLGTLSIVEWSGLAPEDFR